MYLFLCEDKIPCVCKYYKKMAGVAVLTCNASAWKAETGLALWLASELV